MTKRAHFIGICGVGMSATAKLLKDLGWEISGSDDAFYPPGSELVERYGISFFHGYKAENISEDVELIVIGKNAKLIPKENKEVRAAFESGKSIRSFPEVLEGLVEEKHSIVVAGSYGKSTCTALLAHCLLEAGKDLSYFLGAIPAGPMDTARIGKSDFFILEGDEYPSSNWDPTSKFLHYNPHDVLLTSAEHDHVNVFPTHEEFLATFKTLLSLMPSDGLLVACADEKHARALAHTHPGEKVLYGLTHREATWSAKDISYGDSTIFTLTKNTEAVLEIKTHLLGKHNVQNIVGVAAFILEKELLTPEELARGIESFRGVERRLNLLSPHSSVRVYEGFGSSYSKARAAIEAMGLHFPDRRLIVVFEPHTFSWRNRDTIHWYDNVFKGASRILVYEPAAQGAASHKQLTQEEIVERVREAGFDVAPIHSKKEGLNELENILESQDVVLLLTSGDLGGLIEQIPKLVRQKFPV